MTSDDATSMEREETGESAGPVRATWDGSTAPSTAVVEAVARATGRDPLEMPCLHDVLDVDALDRMLTADRARALGSVSVSFTYGEAYVWVDSAGTVEVDPDAATG